MVKKTCGNCRHFAKEPNAGGRGCCFLSDDLGSYPVKGEHYPFCRGWEPLTNWHRFFGTPEKAARTTARGITIEGVPSIVLSRYGEQHLVKYGKYLEWLESEEE